MSESERLPVDPIVERQSGTNDPQPSSLTSLTIDSDRAVVNGGSNDTRIRYERPPVDPLREALAAVRNPHRQGDLHNYGWNDAVAACLRAYDEVASPAAPRPEGLEPWTALTAEARAFEEWYLPTVLGVNAWVGVDRRSGFYGGWSIDGDPLYGDEWDDSVMTTAEGETPEAVIADLIRIARDYRERSDAQRLSDTGDSES